MKRTFRLCMAVCLALLAVLVIASCKPDGGLEFDVNQQPALAFRLSSDGTYYAVAGIGNVTANEITIPAEYAGKPVKTIARGAFANCANITSVTIPASISTVEVDAFAGCTAFLQQEGGVTYAGKWAVACDPAVTAVTLRNDTVGIAQGAFVNCADLMSVSIPDSVKSISANAFVECDNLLQREDGVIYVDKWVVGCVASAKEIKLRNNTVGFAAMSLREGKAPEGLEVPAKVKYINDWAFANAVNIPYVILHDGVEGIGFGAFYNCTGLQSITLGKGLKSIDAEAFYTCKNLNEVIVSDVKAWMEISFHGIASYPNHYGSLLFVDAEGDLVTELTIPQNTTTIGWRAFENATAITKVTIPASVTSIASAAFKGCTALNNVTIPTSITTIAEQTFYGCTSLTSITIPASVTRIYDKAFDACIKLFEVTNLSALTVTAGDTANGHLGYYAKDVFTAAGAASKFSTDENGFVFYNSDASYLVSYVGGESTITLPEQYNGGEYVLSPNAFAGLDITGVVIPASVTKLSDSLFGADAVLEGVYFGGTPSDWEGMVIGEGNEAWISLVSYYSEEAPVDKTVTYWHYVDGAPEIWTEKEAE